MAERQSPQVDTAARRWNQEHKEPRIAHLVERFVAVVNQLAGDDWKNSEGSVGRLILCDDEGKQTYVYEMRDGEMRASDSPGPFVATITMSVDTFLDLVDAALPAVSFQAEPSRRALTLRPHFPPFKAGPRRSMGQAPLLNYYLGDQKERDSIKS